MGLRRIILKLLKKIVDSEKIRPSESRISEILDWVNFHKDNTKVEVSIKDLSSLENWVYSDNGLSHHSGKFFSIKPVDVKILENGFLSRNWQQPIIDQPEVGILGFIVTLIDDVPYFLVQAKIEPGNINHVQLSPTLQATRSNFTQVHKGAKPKYLDFFKSKSRKVLIDQLHSEQGARFYKKRNRNIILFVDQNDIHIEDNFILLNIAEIRELMKHENVVNMDTRTVISNLFPLYAELLQPHCVNFNDDFEILSKITEIKSSIDLSTNFIESKECNDWHFNENKISHTSGGFFEIIGVDVKITNREVSTWNQPMVRPTEPGICGLIMTEYKGSMHFLMQLKIECGNYDVVEIAPTVQTLTGGLSRAIENNLPYLNYFIDNPSNYVVYDSFQSEEGGRFYQEENRNTIIKLDYEKINTNDNYFLCSFDQLSKLLKFNNLINIQARNLLSTININEII